LPADRDLGAEMNSERATVEGRLHEQGLGLTYSEPRLFVDLGGNGAIYFVIYDGEQPKIPIADSFTEFFEHYIASGCFCSHRFDLYWSYVKDLVPIKIPPSENKWIRFYTSLYKEDVRGEIVL